MKQIISQHNYIKLTAFTFKCKYCGHYYPDFTEFTEEVILTNCISEDEKAIKDILE